MTITEKILADHVVDGGGAEAVRPGAFIRARIDLALGNDITAPIAIREFKRAGAARVFDPDRVALLPDHFTPNKDIKSAEQSRILKEFAREQGLKYYFEVGRVGIEHAFLPEQGMVLPGELVIGADSHTCTYGALGAFSTGVGSTDLAAAMALGEVWLRVPETMKFIYHGKLPKWICGKDLILHTIGDIGVDGALYRAMEFTGEVISELSMDGRMTMCNMAIEAGGKNGIIVPDETTTKYSDSRWTPDHAGEKRPYTVYESDEDAEYCEVREYDVSNMEPLVAKPHLPSNTVPVSELKDVRIDQAVIGSCTNGRLEDLQTAVGILRGKKIAEHVRCVILPATVEIYLTALREGWTEAFVEAGCVVSPPTCGPCLGGHMGVLAEGEVAVATTNRNFVGRMGHPGSFVYLSGPAVAAASAVAGRIAHPDEVA